MRGTGNGNVKRENSDSSSESKSVGTQSGGSGFSSSPSDDGLDAIRAMADQLNKRIAERAENTAENNRKIAQADKKIAQADRDTAELDRQRAELRMKYLQDVGDVLAKEGRRAEKIAVKEDANLQKATKHFENVTGGHADKVQSRKKKEAGCIIL